MTFTNVYIIAEAGVNHNGDTEMAFKLIDEAAEAGANAIKFQTFKADKIVTKKAEKALYQKNTTDEKESHYQMLKNLEITKEDHFILKNYCKKIKIDFLSSAFDSESIKFLTEDLKMKTLKIPSGEITNGPLLLDYGKSKCNLIMSTGMATLGEIEEALGVLAFGLLNEKNKTPSKTGFELARTSSVGQKFLKDKVTILHCTSEYPANEKEINLNAIKTIKHAYGLKIGYSDHSTGITIPLLCQRWVQQL